MSEHPVADLRAAQDARTADQSYVEAEVAAFRRAAEAIGVDFSIDANAREVVSHELWFLRNHMASGEVKEISDDTTLTMLVGWGCDHEAAILLGRLTASGWTLVRNG